MTHLWCPTCDKGLVAELKSLPQPPLPSCQHPRGRGHRNGLLRAGLKLELASELEPFSLEFFSSSAGLRSVCFRFVNQPTYYYLCESM